MQKTPPVAVATSPSKRGIGSVSAQSLPPSKREVPPQGRKESLLEFEIIKLAPQNAEPAMALYRRVVKTMREAGFMQWNDGYPNMEYLQRDIAAGTAFGFFMDGTLAAVATFDGNQPKEYEPMPFEFGEPYRVVHRLAVDPDIQRQGLARRMMDFAEALAREKGCEAMRLDTCEDNSAALALYENRGYIRRGTCHFPGRTYTFIVMEKKL
jgi:ribosomal protein S18 acetylase RimI-like enzyme